MKCFTRASEKNSHSKKSFAKPLLFHSIGFCTPSYRSQRHPYSESTNCATAFSPQLPIRKNVPPSSHSKTPHEQLIKEDNCSPSHIFYYKTHTILFVLSSCCSNTALKRFPSHSFFVILMQNIVEVSLHGSVQRHSHKRT